MNYTLIMLDIPVLVSDEFDERGRKIIAGFFGKPKLDLSLIADEIGWVDVYKLAYKYIQDEWSKDDDTLQFGIKVGFRQGFETAQSLNEKKYSEEDMIDFAKFYKGWEAMLSQEKWDIIKDTPDNVFKFWLSKRKPKEYLVEYIQEGNTIKVTKIIK